MTAPVYPTDPLIDAQRLSLWAQERPLQDLEFAEAVIDAVSTLIRSAGSALWSAATIPARARDIACIVARDYYLNPGQLRSETIGPLTETRAESVLRGLSLSEDQRAELAGLAADVDPTAGVDGLWTLSTTRGPVEMSRTRVGGNVVIWDTRGGWPVEYLDESEAVVFEPDDTVL